MALLLFKIEDLLINLYKKPNFYSLSRSKMKQPTLTTIPSVENLNQRQVPSQDSISCKSSICEDFHNPVYDFQDFKLIDHQSFMLSDDCDSNPISHEFQLGEQDSVCDFSSNPLLKRQSHNFSFGEKKKPQSCKAIGTNSTMGTAKKSRHAGIADYKHAESSLILPNLNKSIKKTKFTKRKSRTKLRKINNCRKMNESKLERACNKIFSTFAIEFEDMSSLYPSLRKMSYSSNFSTFPKIFVAGDAISQSKLPFQFITQYQTGKSQS